MFNRATIIKSGEAVLYRLPSLEDMKIEVEEKAEQEAVTPEDVYETALKKSGEIQQKAFEEGFAAGEKAGFKTGEEKALVLTERLEKILSELAVFKTKIFVESEEQVVALAVAIARKIIIEEIRMRPEIIVTMVKEALKRLQLVGTITIRINPALHELFMKKKPELLDIHNDIMFDIDPYVPVTGPLVISQTEEVVTDIESLLSNIVSDMKEVSETGEGITPEITEEPSED